MSIELIRKIDSFCRKGELSEETNRNHDADISVWKGIKDTELVPIRAALEALLSGDDGLEIANAGNKDVFSPLLAWTLYEKWRKHCEMLAKRAPFLLDSCISLQGHIGRLINEKPTPCSSPNEVDAQIKANSVQSVFLFLHLLCMYGVAEGCLFECGDGEHPVRRCYMTSFQRWILGLLPYGWPLFYHYRQSVSFLMHLSSVCGNDQTLPIDHLLREVVQGTLTYFPECTSYPVELEHRVSIRCHLDKHEDWKRSFSVNPYAASMDSLNELVNLESFLDAGKPFTNRGGRLAVLPTFHRVLFVLPAIVQKIFTSTPLIEHDDFALLESFFESLKFLIAVSRSYTHRIFSIQVL